MSGGFRLRCPAPGEKIDYCVESAGVSDFAEDVLKMWFDGVARQAELVRHLLVRLAENQQIDDFLLPLSQVQLREVRGGQRQGCCLTSTQTGQDDRMQVGQIGRSDFHTRVSRADDLHEFLRGGILDDVSHGPGLDPVKDTLIVGIGGEHEDFDVASFLDQKTSGRDAVQLGRSEEHTSELQSRLHLVCRLLLEKKKNKT